MADRGDYGRRRPRTSAGHTSGNASNDAGGHVHVPVGQPRIVYRGRVSSSSSGSVNTAVRAAAAANVHANVNVHGRGHPRHHPWDAGAGAGHADDYGNGHGPSAGRSSPKSRGDGGGKNVQGTGSGPGTGSATDKLAAIRSASPYGRCAPPPSRSSGRTAPGGASGGGGGGGGADDDLLAVAGIQLSDRQRQLMERRRGGGGKGGAGGAGAATGNRRGAAHDGGGGTAAAAAATATGSSMAAPGEAEATDADAKKTKTMPPNKKKEVSPKSSRRKSQSPTRRRSASTTSSSAANRSRRSLAEVHGNGNGNSPTVRVGGAAADDDQTNHGRNTSTSTTSRSASRSPRPRPKPSSSSSSGAIPNGRRVRSASTRGGGIVPVPVPSSGSSSLTSVGRSHGPAGGGTTTRPPSHGGGGGTGNGSNDTAPPRRSRLARSSSSSRRLALGDLDGNSPKRDGGGSTGGRPGRRRQGASTTSPKGGLSKSPLRRSGSSSSAAAAVPLRRSTSAGRSGIGGDDRGGAQTASASASADASTTSSGPTLVVHQDAADTVAAGRPPKAPERAVPAPRGILRPPVYSRSKAGVGGTDVASEQPPAKTFSHPTATITALSAEAKAAPVPVAELPTSSTVGDNAIDSDDEVDAGFHAFMNELMEEVAPDHTELWAGFQSSFGVSPRSMRPLHANVKVEASNAGLPTTTTNSKAQKKKRLGPKAQEALSAIHKDLLENGPPDNYAGKAQLVNDRKIAKERRTQPKKNPSKAAVAATPGSVLASSSSPSDPIQGQGEARIQFAGRTPAPPRRPQHEDAKSSRTKFAGRTPAPPRRSRDNAEDENDVEEVDTSAPQSPRDVSIPASSLRTPAPTKASSAGSAPPPPTNQEPPWLVKLRERQRKLKEEQPDSPNSPTASVEKDPIEKLFGKRVVSTCKKRSADAAYGAGGSGTPWNVKLRSTPAKPKEECSTPWQVKLRATPSKTNGSKESKNVEAKVEAVPFAIGLKKTGFFEKKAIHDPYSKRVSDPKEQWNPSDKAVPMTTVKRPDGTYKVHTQSYLNSSQPSYLLQRQPWLKPSELKPVHESKDKTDMPVSPSHNLGITFGDTVHLNDLPVEVFGPQDEATSVQLCSADEEPASVVIVGKDAVVKATRNSLPGDGEVSNDNSDEATIAWCWHRADIRSLTLNNEATCADLALKRRSRLSLSFNSPEDCMIFAQAFYKLKVHAPAEEAITEAESEPASTETESDDKEDSSSSPDPPSEEASIPSTPSKEDPQEELQGEESNKDLSNPTSVSTALASATAAPSDAPSATTEVQLQPGGRVLTEEEEFVLKQYHEGVITASSVAASCVVPSEGEASSSQSAATSNANSSSSSGPADPRAALLAVIKGGGGGVKSKMAKFEKLSEEDEQIATKYRKMLSMGVPPPAVEHAMKRDQVSDKIVNIILNSGEAPKGPVAEETGVSTVPATDCASNLTEEEQEVAAKYQKMLKVSIPREAVRHKMLRDSISEKIRIAVLGPDADKATKSSGLSLSPADEQIAAQYRKMLKISIPRDAVRNKMMRDNVGVKIIEAVLGKGATAKAASDVVSIVLTKEEEAVAAQYRKMIRFNIPKDAVRHKMMKDNIDARVILAVVGDDEGPATAKKKKKDNNMVALHWTPLSPSALENSIWRTTKKRKLTATAIHDGRDVKKLEELFQKKTTKPGAKGPCDAAAESDGKAMAKLIDLNRANIIAISLKAFQDFSHKELADTIANLDSNTKIVGERVQFLTGLLPNQTEVAVVKSYKGADDRLVPAELFFKNLLSVPRLQTKVHVIQTMATFSDSAKETGSKFQLLKTVCSQVMESTKLQQVLEMVLHIGNLMNEGTRTGDIDGFKFDSLLKLTQTKSQDGKLTVLDYIVTTFIEKNDRSVLDIGSDFPDCETAGRILISDLVSDARGLRMGLNKCRTELTEMKKDQSTKPVTRSQARKFAEAPSKPPLDPRAGLFAAIKARGTQDEEVSEKLPADPRAAMLAAIKSRGSEDDGKTKANNASQEPKQDLSPGVLRLESFLADATSELEALDKTKASAVQACKNLSLYFGEGGSEKSAAPLLSVLSSFCKSIDDALKGYERRKFLEEKKKAAAKKKAKGKTPSKAKTAPDITIPKRKGKSRDGKNADASRPNNETTGKCKASLIHSNQSKPSPGSANADVNKEAPVDSKPNAQNGKSLVLMVNEMLQTASPRTRREFQEGRTYKHPHTRQLKEIYQKEEEQLNEETIEAEPSTPAPTTPPHTAEPRAAMLSAIQSRKLNLESSEAESKPSPDPIDPRAAMLSAIKNRQVDSDPPEPECKPVDPRASMLSAIKARKIE